MWEDERNKRGGRWLITLNKQQRRQDLDRFWLETVGLTEGRRYPFLELPLAAAWSLAAVQTSSDKAGGKKKHAPLNINRLLRRLFFGVFVGVCLPA